MICKQEYKAKGQPSIFISHSSNDIVVARAVRNLLEDRNHHFVDLIGLASLDGNSVVQQFQFLVEEIDSRDWLVLIDSKSARKSKYVKFEIATAEVLRKPIYTIDGSRFVTRGSRYDVETSLRPCVESLSRGLRIFMSYSMHDEVTAHRVADWFAGKGYETFTHVQLQSGMNWKHKLEEEINRAAEYGVMIVILSDNWLASNWASYELELAQKMGGRILPIALEPIEFPVSLAQMQILRFWKYESFEDGMLAIWRALNRIRHEIFEEHCGGVILNDWLGIEQTE